MDNYQSEYAHYWEDAGRWGSDRLDDAALVLDEILSVSGTGPILDAGCGSGLVVRALVSRGISAYGFDVAASVIDRLGDRVPEHFLQASVLAIPFADSAFQSVLCMNCLQHLRPEDVPLAVAELCRVSGRNLFVTVSTRPDRENRWHLTVQPKEWWEEQFLEAGCRRHPLTQKIRPFEILEFESDQITLAFEKIPASAAGRYSRKHLAAERDLHMDMLRECGRRSDAHLARYMLARSFVRPNDVVLDAACGLGYGSAILWEGSEASSVTGVDCDEGAVEYARQNYGSARPGLAYLTANVEELPAVPSNSVDLVVSFETIEHLENPERFLGEMKRVLKPGGRFICSVPNLWVDETGRDPSPYHLHVFDLEKIRSACERFFLIDEVFEQSAGGGDGRFGTSRRLRLFDGNVSSGQGRPEWWLVSAMKDPIGAEDIAYTETVFPAGEAAQNAVAFARDYVNPWLVHAVIHGAFRARSSRLLTSLAWRAVERYPDNSAEVGGALCVLAYLQLERAESRADLEPLYQRILDYLSSRAATPHAWRWQISLRFVLGKLDLFTGRHAEARNHFLLCAGMDFLQFSPHLATKPCEAAFLAGWISLWMGDPGTARDAWSRGLEIGRVLTGLDWEDVVIDPMRPAHFGCGDGVRELTVALDHVTKCANGLRYLSTAPRSGGARRIEDCLQSLGQWAQRAERILEIERKQKEDYKAWAERLESSIHAERQQAAAYRAWAERLEQTVLEERKLAAGNREWAERVEAMLLEERALSAGYRAWAERLENELSAERETGQRGTAQDGK